MYSEQQPNEKMGNVVKCPSCGAQVVGGSAVCPECGYAFTNVKANSSIERLQEKLDAFNRRQEERADKNNDGNPLTGMFRAQSTMMSQALSGSNPLQDKMNIITTFPVPNSRADLLEFMSMLQPMAKSNGSKNGKDASLQEDMSYAYWILYSNCINKARISFSKDPDFEYFFTKYDEEVNRPKGIMKLFTPQGKKALLVGGGILLCLVIFFAVATSGESSTANEETKIEETVVEKAPEEEITLDPNIGVVALAEPPITNKAASHFEVVKVTPLSLVYKASKEYSGYNFYIQGAITLKCIEDYLDYDKSGNYIGSYDSFGGVNLLDANGAPIYEELSNDDQLNLWQNDDVGKTKAGEERTMKFKIKVRYDLSHKFTEGPVTDAKSLKELLEPVKFIQFVGIN